VSKTAAFQDPGLIDLTSSSQPERAAYWRWLPALRAAGYTRFVEPCCGSLGLTRLAVAAGYSPSDCAVSDVSFLAAVIGFVASGRPLADLDIRIDGEPVPLSADPLVAGATLLYDQWRLRLDLKPSVPYWAALQALARSRRPSIIENLAAQLQRVTESVRGASFRLADIVDHLAAVREDPHAVVALAPPTYWGGFEKLANTGGRLTWAEPAYRLFDPATGVRELVDLAATAQAFVICEERCAPGAASRPDWVVSAREDGRGRMVYLQVNRPTELPGVPRVGRRGRQPSRPAGPIIPRDHPITPGSRLEAVRLTRAQAAYYRDLWSHRLDLAVMSGVEQALCLDGYVAGVLGLSAQPIAAPHRSRVQPTLAESCLLLTYGFGAPHRLRLTRLVTACAIQGHFLRYAVPAWVLVRAEGIITATLTPHPEAKEYRGTPFKLQARRPDPIYGQRLIYVAPIQHDTPEEVLTKWLTNEARWASSRSLATSSPSPGSRSRPSASRTSTLAR